MKIDDNTGLPEVPEGFFWKVYKGSPRYAYVALMHRSAPSRVWGRRKVREIDSRITARTDLDEQRIVVLAGRILRDNGPGIFNVITDGNRLFGSYPPKRLNGESN